MKTPFRSFLNSDDLKQFFRFIIVGCSNFAVSFTVFYLCYEHLHLASLLLKETGDWGRTIFNFISETGIKMPNGAFANIIAYTCGLMNSFLWNRIWTFKVFSRITNRFKRFIILNIFCLALSSIIIFIFVDFLNCSYKMTWFIAMVFVTILNFFGNKFWVFKHVGINYNKPIVFTAPHS